MIVEIRNYRKPGLCKGHKLGVIMNFYVEKNRVKFSINNDSAKRAKLKINSMLLDVARKFQEEQ